jgi:predicted phosphodiesterase
MKLLVYTDPHFSSVNLSCRKDYFPDTILEKMGEVLNIGLKKKVDKMVCVGDFAHNKTMSDWYKNRIISLFRAYPFHNLCVVGNHDEKFDDPESVLAAPLGIMLNSGVMNPKPGDLVVRENGVNLYMLPFMGRVQDFPIDTNPSEMNILFAHYFLDTAFDDEVLPKNLIGRFQYIFLGHDHDVYQPFKLRNPETGAKSIVLRPGALSRGTRHRSNWDRGIFVAYLDTDTGEYEYIPVPCKSAKEVFNVEGMAVRESLKASPIIRSLAQSVGVGNSTSIASILKALNLRVPLLERTKYWLQEGGIVYDEQESVG